MQLWADQSLPDFEKSRHTSWQHCFAHPDGTRVQLATVTTRSAIFFSPMPSMSAMLCSFPELHICQGATRYCPDTFFGDMQCSFPELHAYQNLE